MGIGFLVVGVELVDEGMSFYPNSAQSLQGERLLSRLKAQYKIQHLQSSHLSALSGTGNYSLI